MVKKPWIIRSLVAAGFGLLACFVWSQFSPANYHGRSPRYWAARLALTEEPARAEAKIAFRKLGSNAVPALVNLLTNTSQPLYDRCFWIIAPRLPRAWKARAYREYYPPDPIRVRMTALEALGIIGPDARAAIPDLTRTVARRQPVFVAGALGALASIGREALPVLRPCLADKDPVIRRDTIKALELLDGQGAAVLGELYYLQNHDPQDFVRFAASNAVFTLARAAPAALPELAHSRDPRDREVAAHRAGVSFTYNRKLVPEIIKLARDPDLAVRREVISTLGRVVRFNPETVPALAGALRDANANIRVLAFKGLSRAGARAAPAVPALIEETRNPDPVMRAGACRTLGEIGPAAASALTGLNELRSDQEESVRSAASAAISAIGAGTPRPPPN